MQWPPTLPTVKHLRNLKAKARWCLRGLVQPSTGGKQYHHSTLQRGITPTNSCLLGWCRRYMHPDWVRALLPHWMEWILSELKNCSPLISSDQGYMLGSVLQIEVMHLGSCICKAPQISTSFGWCFIKWHLKKHCKARRVPQKVQQEPWSFFFLRVLKSPSVIGPSVSCVWRFQSPESIILAIS